MHLLTIASKHMKRLILFPYKDGKWGKKCTKQAHKQPLKSVLLPQFELLCLQTHNGYSRSKHTQQTSVLKAAAETAATDLSSPVLWFELF